MSLGRRRVGLHEQERWVYNRMADAYAARPPYPDALVERLSALAGSGNGHILDVGAGLGHLSLPLAARGHEVTAVEPALAMLHALSARAREAAQSVRAVHASAEALPLPDASVGLAVIADALHFLDAHRAGSELARVLSPDASLAFVQVEPGSSPFMQALSHCLQQAAPRRPRQVSGAMAQIAALTGVSLTCMETFDSQVPLELPRLEQLLGSISFIGPAMNAERFARLCAQIRLIPHAPCWHTYIRLHAGRRGAQAGNRGMYSSETSKPP